MTGPTEKKEKEFHATVAKLVLSLGLQVRILYAACIDVMTIEISQPMAEAALTAGTNYNEKTKGNSGHGLGPPHPFAWTALIGTIAKVTRKAVKTEWTETLMNHLRSVIAMGNEVIGQTVKVCRVKKCYDKKYCNIMICLDPQARDVWLAAKGVMEAAGGTHRSGIAPASGMERTLQRLLQDLYPEHAGVVAA